MQHASKSGDWDMKPYEVATNSVSTLDQLHQIRMSPDERRMAREYLRQAELLADTIMRVNAHLRHALGFVGRGNGAQAHRGRVSTVRLEPN
jgi:hypothetical protein